MMGLVAQIEEMALEAEALRSVSLATYDAIYNGCDDYGEFDGALHTVFLMAHDHMKHMKMLMDEAYVLQKAEETLRSERREA